MAKSYLDSLLGEREQIQHIARQHWFILLRSIALEIFTILVMLAAIITSVILLPDFLLITFVVGFGLLLIPIVSMIHDVLIYTHHEYIVTNRRVIQISGILNKQVINSSLEKVNDVKMAQSALGRIFQLWRCGNPDRQRAWRQPVQAHRESGAIQDRHAERQSPPGER